MTKKKTEDIKQHPRLYTAEPNVDKMELHIQQTFIVKLNPSFPEHKEDIQSVVREEKAVKEEKVIKEIEVEPFVQEETIIWDEEEITEQDQQESLDMTEDIQLAAETEITEAAEVRKEAEESTRVIAEEAEEKKDGKSQVLSRNLTKKSFKDMNNEEKIYFFIHRPHYIPNVKCRIATEKDIFVGFILSYEDGYVSINSTQSFEKIYVKFADIVSIQIMGI